MTYYRVWYKNYKGETTEYAHGLTKEMAEYFVKTLMKERFEAWYEEE